MGEGRNTLSIFEGYGIELEYMIVNQATLAVMPVTDKVIQEVTGEITGDAELDDMGWSNELVLHVIEIKTNGPSKKLDHLPQRFHDQVKHINQILKNMGGKLMPTAMHPWMNPYDEMQLWPHDNSPVYDAYNRIFDCRGHGWANLQSMHINLPFKDDEEFGKLHAAIRLVLPILPAIAASSPIVEGTKAECHDQRLEVYRNNQAKVPSIAGKVIPEAVFSKEEYYTHIFAPLYKDIAPYDPEGILQDEWLNSRGAIARFDRNTIEIRLIDIQECPQADLAIAALVVEVIKALVSEKWSTLQEQKTQKEEDLAYILLDCIRVGEKASIHDIDYLQLFGLSGNELTAKDLWAYLVKELMTGEHERWKKTLEFIIDSGTLSTRIMVALDSDLSAKNLHAVYNQLCECLDENKMFSPNA
ncbi:MAG: carboxylate-amine ligase [Bacteroidia bacterium]